MRRILSDLGWVILLVIVPWCVFENLFLPACERAMGKRLEALKDGKGD